MRGGTNGHGRIDCGAPAHGYAGLGEHPTPVASWEPDTGRGREMGVRCLCRRSNSLGKACHRTSPLLQSRVMQSLPRQLVDQLKPALAGLMAGLILLLALVASSERLHNRFHGSSTDGQSPCAICSVVRGHIDAPAPASPASAIALIVAWILPRFESARPQPVDYSVASSRGPPTSSSSL